jgi:hypothetical protein
MLNSSVKLRMSRGMLSMRDSRRRELMNWLLRQLNKRIRNKRKMLPKL